MAIAAARAGNRRDARRHIHTAETVATRLGADRNDHDTEFGPTNVGLHAVAVAVELGDAGEALDRAEQLDTAGLSAERRARFLLDVGGPTRSAGTPTAPRQRFSRPSRSPPSRPCGTRSPARSPATSSSENGAGPAESCAASPRDWYCRQADIRSLPGHIAPWARPSGRKRAAAATPPRDPRPGKPAE